jgi:hypothetical protein
VASVSVKRFPTELSVESEFANLSLQHVETLCQLISVPVGWAVRPVIMVSALASCEMTEAVDSPVGLKLSTRAPVNAVGEMTLVVANGPAIVSKPETFSAPALAPDAAANLCGAGASD